MRHMTGGSQAVRLPKALRFESDEVRMRKKGKAVIPEPVPGTPSWLDGIVHRIDVDFLDAVAERPGDQIRPGLDRL